MTTRFEYWKLPAAPTPLDKRKPAWRLGIDFALAAAQVRHCGGDFYSLKKWAIAVGTAAGREGLSSPPKITAPYRKMTSSWEMENLGWSIDLFFKLNSPDLRPDEYFFIEHSNASITITSKGLHGARGWIKFNKATMGSLFSCPLESRICSYTKWAEDPYPVGGSPSMLRIDDPEHENHKQLALEPDMHPCSGRLYFGYPDQECDQIAAFCGLYDAVRGMFIGNELTQEQKLEVQARAKRINETSGVSFMPSSGICPACESDVTKILLDVAEGSLITGCPVCFKSWCD